MKKGKDYIGVSCGALIFNEKGKILIGQRGVKASDNNHQWDLLGGKIDFGETSKKAIIREVEEEAGIKIEIIKLNNIVEVVSENKHWIGPVYIAKVLSGIAKPMEKDKFTEFKWMRLEEIEKLELAEPCKQTIKAYKENQKEK